MSYTTLENYYTTLFSMVHHHKYSITEIENMIPFERDIFIDLFKNYLNEEEKAAQRAS